MRKKERKLVISFRTTTEAMAMEKICKAQRAPGRLIPLPRAISAGCGLAWAADPAGKEQLMKLMAEAGLKEEALHEILL